MRNYFLKNPRSLIAASFFLLAIVLLGVGCGPGEENQNPSTGLRIVGTVTSEVTGQPIANAKVLLMGSGINEVYTDSDGEFRIEDVPEGTYSLEVTHADYKDVIQTVVIDRNDQPTYVTVGMEAK